MLLFKTIFPNKALTLGLLTFFLVVLTGCGGGDGDTSTGGGGSAGDPALVSTWTLSSVDGDAVPAGTAMLTITESTYSFTGLTSAGGPSCTETGTYTVSGNMVTNVVSTSTGGGCNAAGTTYMSSYTVTATTLTLVDEDGETTVWTRT